MNALWNQFKHALGQVRRRTVIFTVIGALLFLLPTTIAIGWVIQENKPTQALSFSVTVFDQNHNQIAAETASEDPASGTNMADVLYRITTNSTQIDRAPFLPEDGTPIYVSAIYNGVTTEYICYFSVSGDGSYYIKGEQIFLISPADASSFLSFPESESLYRIAEPPALFTNTDETVVPTKASWFYKLQNDTFQQAKNCQVADGAPRTYSFSSSLELRFAEEPDVCTVSVTETKTGRLAYEGSYQGLSQLTVNPEASLQIHVRAIWKDQEASMCHGELSYNFIAALRDCASFSLDKQTLSPHEFLILTCENIRGLDHLFFQAPDTMTRYYFTNNSTVYCVIPYPTATNADTLEFTVTHGAAAKHFTVPLLDAPNEGSLTIPSTGDDIVAAAQPSALTDLTTLLYTKIPALSQTIYFRGNIAALNEYGFETGYRFRDQLTVTGIDQPIQAKGTEYLAASGTAVPAMISGEVVATGYCDALGNYVVLNHGLGIQTWYAHLSDLDVRVGDIVAIGESIGKAGVGGIYSGSGVLILCTVNGHLCDPASLKK